MNFREKKRQEKKKVFKTTLFSELYSFPPHSANNKLIETIIELLALEKNENFYFGINCTTKNIENIHSIIICKNDLSSSLIFHFPILSNAHNCFLFCWPSNQKKRLDGLFQRNVSVIGISKKSNENLLNIIQQSMEKPNINPNQLTKTLLLDMPQKRQKTV